MNIVRVVYNFKLPAANVYVPITVIDNYRFIIIVAVTTGYVPRPTGCLNRYFETGARREYRKTRR